MNELRMGYKQAILQRIQTFEHSTNICKSTGSLPLASVKTTTSVSPKMQPAQITDFSINRILGEVPKASPSNKKSTTISVNQHPAMPKCAATLSTTNDSILDLSKSSTADIDPLVTPYSATYAAFHQDFLAAAAAANATKFYAQFFPHIFPAAYPYPVISKRYFAPYVLNSATRASYRYPATVAAAATATNQPSTVTSPPTDILRPKVCPRDCTDCVAYYNQFSAKAPSNYGAVVTSASTDSPYLKTMSAAELLLNSSTSNSMISSKSIRSVSGKISKVHSQGGDSPSASPPSAILNLEEISYKCRICDKVFGCSQTLQAHERTHKSPRYECTDCGKGFSQLRNYKYHLSVHRGTKEFAAECPECGKTFNDKGYLSSHMKIHRNKKEYECPYCPKSFNQRVAFNMHVRIHTGVKPHKCVECGKRFSRKMLLKQHMRTHSGEKPYQCSVCGKSFADRSNMTLHHRLHSGIKPFNCPICPKAFTKKHHLKTHLNYHTGCKPYVCPHPNCNQAFTQSSNMRTHAKKCQYRPLQLVFPASASTMDSKMQSTVTTAAATTTATMAMVVATTTNNFTPLRLPHTSTMSSASPSSALSAGIRMFSSTSFNAVQTQLPPAQQQLMASLRPF